jgi:hypothetical protein
MHKYCMSARLINVKIINQKEWQRAAKPLKKKDL